jgi:hypothetical protein
MSSQRIGDAPLPDRVAGTERWSRCRRRYNGADASAMHQRRPDTATSPPVLAVDAASDGTLARGRRERHDRVTRRS